MTVVYEILEEYTGFRDETPVRDIKIKFIVGDVIHERPVRVCVDDNGNYDHAATLVRIEEVGRGVVNKVLVGAIN